MPEQVTRYRVFIASPSGLEAERQTFRETLEHYNRMDAGHRGMTFFPVGWEETLGGPRRPQSMINDDLRECDYFVLILWNHWGSPPDVDSDYSSGCEEEFDVALECLHDSNRSMRQVVLFFKAVAPEQMADPGRDLQRVLDFRGRIEREKKHLFETVDSLEHFQSRLQMHLARWVRDHEAGAIQPVTPSLLDALEPDDELETPSHQKLEEAERLANQGRLTEAEEIFARLTTRGRDLDALYRYGVFLRRTGRLDDARSVLERILELAGPDDKEWSARTLRQLGLVSHTRGELKRAEEMHRKALALNEKLGRKESMASNLGNLGLISRTQGDLGIAEATHRKALALNEELGSRKGMARDYGNLASVLWARGQLGQAERMTRKSLSLHEDLDDKEGMAINYDTLGSILLMGKNREGAEEYYRKSLMLHEQMGNKEGMANEYGNLGVILSLRGQDSAEEMHHRSLVLNKELGHKEGILSNCHNLGLIHQKRGELDKAEAMYREALDCSEQLGATKEMASLYYRLASVQEERGELDRAEVTYREALSLFKKAGEAEGIEMAEHSLRALSRST